MKRFSLTALRWILAIVVLSTLFLPVPVEAGAWANVFRVPAYGSASTRGSGNWEGQAPARLAEGTALGAFP